MAETAVAAIQHVVITNSGEGSCRYSMNFSSIFRFVLFTFSINNKKRIQRTRQRVRAVYRQQQVTNCIHILLDISSVPTNPEFPFELRQFLDSHFMYSFVHRIVANSQHLYT